MTGQVTAYVSQIVTPDHVTGQVTFPRSRAGKDSGYEGRFVTNWEFVHRLFQFVSVASRPLRVEELAELLAFDFNTGPIPKYHEDWRMEDPVHAVLSTCSSLLTIVDGGRRLGKVIQFSH